MLFKLPQMITIAQIKDLFSPTLRGNKHYTPIDDFTDLCSTCGKQKKKGMICRENSTFYCTDCYTKDIGTELKVTLNKRKLYLWGFLLGSIFIIENIFFIASFIPSNNIDKKTRDAIIAIYYPQTDKTISRDTFELQVDTLIKYAEIPELSFAINFHESRFNPSALSVTGARGSAQIVNGWVKKLVAEGVIQDARDLHDPVKGIIAGDKVQGYHLSQVNGDLMKGLNDYVGSKTPAGETKYVKDVLATYGRIVLLERAIKNGRVDKKNMCAWWGGVESPPVGSKKIKKAVKKEAAVVVAPVKDKGGK